MFLASKLRKEGVFIMTHREGKKKRCKDRLPYRNHLQITLLREIALLTKAGMKAMTSQHISHVVVQTVGCRLHWRRIQLTETTDRQERQSRWILDQ